MAYKMMVLDIDGTLLNSQMVISKQTKAALLASQKRGITLVLSSARPLIGMRKLAEELEMSQFNGYLSAFNGGEIVKLGKQETIHIKEMAASDIHQLFDLVKGYEETELEKIKVVLDQLEESDIPRELKSTHDLIAKGLISLMTYCDEALIVERVDRYSVIEILLNSMKLVPVENFKEEVQFPSVKCLVSSHPETIASIYPKLRKDFGDQADVVTSDPFFIEVTSKGINKGNSLVAIAEDSGIKLKEIVAVGDSQNDLSMIEKAGLGVAMGNATEAVKKLADFVTKTNDEDGIETVINTYFT